MSIAWGTDVRDVAPSAVVGPCAVLYFMPGCQFCEEYAPEFNRVPAALKAAGVGDMRVYAVNIVKHAPAVDAAGQPVRAVPLIEVVAPDGSVRMVEGRTAADVVKAAKSVLAGGAASALEGGACFIAGGGVRKSKGGASPRKRKGSKGSRSKARAGSPKAPKAAGAGVGAGERRGPGRPRRASPKKAAHGWNQALAQGYAKLKSMPEYSAWVAERKARGLDVLVRIGDGPLGRKLSELAHEAYGR